MKCQLCQQGYFLFNVPPRFSAADPTPLYTICRDCISLVARTWATIKAFEEPSHGIR